MSLVTSASLWTNEDSNNAKRKPNMLRKTIKIKPGLKTNEEPEEYVSYSENYQNRRPNTMDENQTIVTDRNNRVNDLLNKITAVETENSSGDKMGDFVPLPNPNINVKKDMGDHPAIIRYANSNIRDDSPSDYYANDAHVNDLSSYKTSYEQPMKFSKSPYSSGSTTGQRHHQDNNSELMEKVNYMINLLQEQQMEKTNNITEEFILYTFLGVFIIFVVDSFARSGKYIR
jgi:hypothetical protein